MVRRSVAGGAVAPDAAPAKQAGAKKAHAKKGWTVIEQSFEVDHAIDRVWAFFGDMPAVASCLPGARITEILDDRVTGSMTVKFGPIAAAFAGQGASQRDDGSFSGRLAGGGSDSTTGTKASGEVAYSLHDLDRTTRVDIVLAFKLQGALAQFGRSGLVHDLAARITAEFAENLNRKMAGGQFDSAIGDPAIAGPGIGDSGIGDRGRLNLAGLLWKMFRDRVRRLFRK